MFVSSILKEVKAILGTCDDQTAFRRLTDAVQLANNQAKANDWNVGQMDIAGSGEIISLPSDVGTVLASNVDGQPTLLRDQWFQCHVNGPGVTGWTPWNYTDELGSASIIRDIDKPLALYAQVEAKDVNSNLRVFGWDGGGKRIFTPNSSGVLEDGFLVPTTIGSININPHAPAVAQIDRVQKVATNGYVKLYGFDPDAPTVGILLGNYQPWETTPSYRRIRVPGCSWIRIKYRKKDLEVRGESDWINIENRQAVLLLVKSVKMRLTDGQIEQASTYEREGIRLLSNEAESLNPPGLSAPQIIFEEGIPSSDEDRLFY